MDKTYKCGNCRELHKAHFDNKYQKYFCEKTKQFVSENDHYLGCFVILPIGFNKNK